MEQYEDGKRLVGRWESKGGAYTLEVWKAEGSGWYYRAVGAGGYLGNHYTTDDEAIAAIGDINRFQPDANKTPMQRVK